MCACVCVSGVKSEAGREGREGQKASREILMMYWVFWGGGLREVGVGGGSSSSRGRSDVNTQFHNGTGTLFGLILTLRSHFCFFVTVKPAHAWSHFERGGATAATGRRLLCVCVCVCVSVRHLCGDVSERCI